MRKQKGDKSAFGVAAGSHLLVWWTTYVDCLFISEHRLLARAVKSGGYDGTYCDDVNGQNWFDARDALLR